MLLMTYSDLSHISGERAGSYGIGLRRLRGKNTLSIQNMPIRGIYGYPSPNPESSTLADVLSEIGSDVPVIVLTVDGSKTPGRLISVGADRIAMDETVGSGPILTRRVIARHEIPIAAVSRISIPVDQ